MHTWAGSAFGEPDVVDGGTAPKFSAIMRFHSGVKSLALGGVTLFEVS